MQIHHRSITRWLTLSTLILLHGFPIVALACLITRSFWPISACSLLAVGIMLTEAFLKRTTPVEEKPSWVPPPVWDDGSRWVETRTPDGAIVFENADAPVPMTGSSAAGDDEVAFLRQRLEAEMKAKWQLQEQVLTGPASARITGRVARIDSTGDEAAYRTLLLAVEAQEGGHQAIRVRAVSGDVVQVRQSDLVSLTCHWRHGRLTVSEVEARSTCEDPLPELPEVTKPGTVPDWFESHAKNERRELLKASDGSSSVSDLKVHIVWATKRRGKVLTAPMVERLKVLADEVVKTKELGRLLAVNGEEDHVHIALWLPVTISGSEALGTIKAYTSRFLRREFPELREHDDEALWQRGGYVGAIGNGGDLSVVLKYIAEQQAPGATQGDQEGGETDSE